MARRFEHYITDDDNTDFMAGNAWVGQTFTPSIPHTITSVKLKLYRIGSPGTLTVGIRATSSGKPTGADLCSGTIDGNGLTTDTAGAWYEITFGAGTSLSVGTMYAIVGRALDGTISTDEVRWRVDRTSSTYSGGTEVYSTNGGSIWYIDTYDNMFEEWGTVPAWTGKISGVTDPAKIAGVAVANIILVKGYYAT